MAKKKIIKDEVKSDPYADIMAAHEKKLQEAPEKPKRDSVKVEAIKLQHKLRKNQFYSKYEEFKVSKEVLDYFNNNKLDKYNQELRVE